MFIRAFFSDIRWQSSLSEPREVAKNSRDLGGNGSIPNKEQLKNRKLWAGKANARKQDGSLSPIPSTRLRVLRAV